jgi:hypothetical protein
MRVRRDRASRLPPGQPVNRHFQVFDKLPPNWPDALWEADVAEHPAALQQFLAPIKQRLPLRRVGLDAHPDSHPYFSREYLKPFVQMLNSVQISLAKIVSERPGIYRQVRLGLYQVAAPNELASFNLLDRPEALPFRLWDILSSLDCHWWALIGINPDSEHHCLPLYTVAHDLKRSEQFHDHAHTSPFFAQDQKDPEAPRYLSTAQLKPFAGLCEEAEWALMALKAKA